MNSLDQQVLEHLNRWLARGDTAWLCTIVATLGSSPRPVGSLFACNADGETAGTLSGGCVEDDLVQRLRAGELQAVQLLEYGVTAEENERLGLPCGGRLEILLEPLDADVLPQLQTLLEAVAERRYIARRVRLEDGAVELLPASGFAPLERDAEAVTHTFGPRYRMLLIGAGALSETLSRLASAMDYQVLINEPLVTQING